MIIIVIYAMPMKLMTQIIRYNSLIIINIVVVKRNMRMVIVKNINHVKENDKTQIITVLNPKLLLYFKWSIQCTFKNFLSSRYLKASFVFPIFKNVKEYF